ncbi:hypothetical protein [Roseibium sp.]|uniref:hypothetical protein n=1 Tax=Roseibium sp. TaxID=1936156 RepID=UPI003A97D2E7
MADYYSILKKTIGSLPENNGAARRSVYSRARNAIVNQLKAYEPPLSPSEITAEQLRLEEAIRKVEAEAARESLGLAPQNKPAQSKPSEPKPAEPAQTVVADEPDTAPEGAPPAAHEPKVTSSGSASGQLTPAAAGRIEPKAPVSEPSSPLKKAVEEADGLGEASHKAVQSTRDAMAESDSSRMEPSFGSGMDSGDDNEDIFASEDEDEAVEARPAGRARGRKSASAALRQRDSKLPFALVGLLVVIAVGIAAVIYSQRDMVAEIVSDEQTTPPAVETSEPAAPEVAEAPAEAIAPAEDESSKIEDRLLNENGDPAAASDARSVTTTLITPTSPPAPAEPTAPVAAEPQADTAAPSQENLISSVDPQTSEAALTGDGEAQRSILYEEGENSAGAGTASQGQVVWAVEEETTLDGQAQSVLSMSVDIPERDVSVDIRIKPNSDASLPASHLVEIKYNFPETFAAGDVVNVPGLVMKPTEEARGDALIGASVKVSPGYFWIALSNINSETERNIGLLRERGWIDIPMLYENGKRGILTLEKGETGSAAVEQALAAWLAG